MSTVPNLTLLAPLAGWSAPLDEAPDEVFAGRILGDGVAIDPVSSTLCAPCDAEVVVIAAARHAVTLRTLDGCEVLLHVGIDSVALKGQGFELHARQGSRVRAGEPLLSFDLDLIARSAKSVLTPVIVGGDGGFRIVRRTSGCEVAVGDFLMEVASPAATAAVAAADGSPSAAPAAIAVQRFKVGFPHGLHARSAALLADSLKGLTADVRILAHAREADARSVVSLMALEVEAGEEIEIRASGRDAQRAVKALAAALSAGLPARLPVGPS